MKKLVIIGLSAVVIVVGIFFATKGTSVVPPTSAGSYVALGDSVAAGVGLKPESDSSACDRTQKAYSHSVAQALNLKLTHVACSGATIQRGLVGSQEVNKLAVTPQITQLFKKSKPKLITVTIGANDVGWTSYLKKCYFSTCGDAEDQQSVDTNFAILETNLNNLLDSINTHYKNKPPKVIFTSYYQVFPTLNQRCLDLTGITDAEIAWARTQQARISTTVEQAIKQSSYAQYATVNFSGHELCTKTPWVQGVTDSNPYHPTQAGQDAIASSVIKAYRSKTK